MCEVCSRTGLGGDRKGQCDQFLLKEGNVCPGFPLVPPAPPGPFLPPPSHLSVWLASLRSVL